MEPLFFALAAVPFVLTALVMRASRVDESNVVVPNVWMHVARENGFVERDDGSWVLRLDDDLEVQLTGRPERREGGHVQAVVPLFPKLSTELHVTAQKGSLSSDARVSGDFDARFRVKSPRPQRAARVLRRGTAARLVAADGAGWHATLSHEQVKVVGRWLNQRWQVRALCQQAVLIARGLVADEAALPELVPWPAIRRAWGRAAEAIGASLDDEARVIELSAPFGALSVHARTEREERWFAEIAIVFDRPLDVELELVSVEARSLWDKLSKRDLEIGDTDFDERFFVTGADVERVRALLDPELRAALTELERLTGTVMFTAARIDARCEGNAAVDASALERRLRAAARVAELILERARKRRGDAYR